MVYEHPTDAGSLKFTIGITRCGKSTYCNRWVKFLEDYERAEQLACGDFTPRTIVCTDDIRLALHGQRFLKDAEAMAWAIHTYMVKAHLIRGTDVIIDGTNTTEDSILRILNADPDATYVLIDTPPEVCKERAVASGHLNLVEKGVIDRHARQLAKLKEEGVDKVVERIRARVKSRWGLS